MKQKLILFIILIALFNVNLLSQNFSREYGIINQTDLDLIKYEKDTSAEAIVIYDIGHSIFVEKDGFFYIEFERTTKIKILSNAGLDYANIEIPFYKDNSTSEKVYDIDAYTYNYENEKLKSTKLDNKNIFEEKITDKIYIKKFAMPNVNVGSILEYKYTLLSPFKFNLPDWQFQSKIPTIYSKYVVDMIPFYEYVFILQGASKFDIHYSYLSSNVERMLGSYSYAEMTSEFVMLNVPAFKDESYITSINDYIIKIDFQLSKVKQPDGITSSEIMSSWKSFNNDLLKDDRFGKYITKSKSAASKIIKENNLLSKSEDERFEFLVNYVKSNYKWNEFYGYYTSKSFKKFNIENTGNAANINLYLVSLFNAAGLESYPVVISTREHGKVIKKYPFSIFFNYVIAIVKINEKWYYADGTDIFCSYNQIPIYCFNDDGLIVQKNQENWTKIAPTKHSVSLYNFDISLNIENNEILSNCSFTFSENSALEYRKTYYNNEEKIIESFENDNLEINDLKVENFEDLKKPYIINFNAKSDVEKIEDKIYISPYFNFPMSDNPLKQNERQYPVDMVYVKTQIFQSTILIPENYKIDYLPKDFFIKNDIVDFSYTITNFESEVKIMTFYQFKKSIYQPEDYKRLKFSFEKIIEKLNEKVVIYK